MKKSFDVSKWQILRCIYDYGGMYYIEVEEPDKFEEYVKEYGEDGIGYFIGEIIELEDGRKCARKLLEGDEEILKFVLNSLKDYYL